MMRFLTILMLVLPLAAQSETPETIPDELERSLRAAHAELAEAASRVAELQRELAQHRSGTPEVMKFRALQRPRAMVGIILGKPESGQGAIIVGLTPGSPARAAGLRRGDRIVAVNGQAPEPDGPEAVTALLGDLKAGDSVQFTVERDRERLDFEVEAREFGRLAFDFLEEDPGFFGLGALPPDFKIGDLEAAVREISEKYAALGREHLPRLLHIAPAMARMHFILPGELAANHAGLAPYFGTDKGVLVVRIDDRALGLESGDVILEINGEPVSRPADVGRILVAEEPGTAVRFEIMRGGEKRTIDSTIPERPALSERFSRSMGKMMNRVGDIQ